MQRLLLMLLLVGLYGAQAWANETVFGGIQLLAGYSAKRSSAVDAEVWTIERQGGMKIYFEAGPNEGSWADPQDRNNYAWYREQTIKGCTVRFALVKPGLKTQWERSESGESVPGNILLATFLLGGKSSDHTANFSAKIASKEDLADALLMIMSFDPSKGNF
jgi:hypothetical protein